MNNDHRDENRFELSDSFPELKNPGSSMIILPVEDIIAATITNEKEKEEALSALELSSEL